MSPSQAASPPAPRGTAPWAYGATSLAVVLATALAVASGVGPAFALVPAALAGAVWAIVKAPLRWSAAAFLVLGLAVDDTSETQGQWRTPLAFLGDLFHNRLDLVTGVSAEGLGADLVLVPLGVTGMEVLVLALLLVWAHRKATGTSLDESGRVGSASVLRALLVVYTAAVVLAVANGVLHGQSVVPWKVRNLLHPILLYVVFDAAFRGPADHALLARVVVFAAAVRSVLAVIVQRIAIADTGGKYLTATSHGDSVLFAVATYLVIVDVLERLESRRVARAALLLPLLAAGMQQNGRRLVWVMLVLMLLVAYLITPMVGWKRWLTRVALVVLPVLSLYVAVGWNRGGRIFGPVQTLRGVTDTSYDHSAYWREVENWNIAMSMRERPLLGLGLGGSYTEHMHNDDISSAYAEYREWPHNTVLGQLLLLGLFGFVAVWSLFAALAFLAVRSYLLAREKDHRVAALTCLGAVVACHVLAYGDTGAHYPQYKILVALALAVAGKLAVATGAWPARPGSPGRGGLVHEK
jgi:O-antigen ligase